MKLKRYLKEYQGDVDHEESRVKKISKEKAIHLLKTKAKKALTEFLKTGNHVQRYSYGKSNEYGFIDASKLPDRMSRNTLNYYTQIINHDPTWKKFPRRQVIASWQKSDRIDQFDSGTSIIFPYDSTKIGIIPATDAWDGFKNFPNYTSARSYNQFINKLFNGGSLGTAHDGSLKEMKARAKEFDKKVGSSGIGSVKEYYEEYGESRLAKTLDNYDGDLYKNILHYYSPEGFKVSTPGKIPAKDGAEVWFEGPAVYINSTEIEDIEEELKNEIK